MSSAVSDKAFPDFPGGGSLWIGVEPCPGEAMSSWLRRICRMHRCSIKGMRRMLILNARDPDFDWPWSTSSTASFLAVTPATVERVLAWRQSQISTLGREAILSCAPGRPVRACPTCIRLKDTVFFRTESRLSFVSACHIHRVKLIQMAAELVGLDPRSVEIPEPISVNRRAVDFEMEVCALARLVPRRPASEPNAHLEDPEPEQPSGGLSEADCLLFA